MKKCGIIIIIIFISAALWGLTFAADFSGSYEKIPSIRNPWCGKAIEIKKIRHNKFRISWQLVNGEWSIAELVGRINGDMLDFRNLKGHERYGYTYALADNKNRLIVTLTSPNKNIICQFTRTRREK
ncbi:MAG: hypothetical protein JW807_07410 [Spirochaetes bacterium]|nr:hypothetical protein [Spirochaetota bacterium]